MWLAGLAIILTASAARAAEVPRPIWLEAGRSSGGAMLKTSPTHEGALKLAAAYASDKNYEYACEFWQKILNENSDALISSDDRVYLSLATAVEQSIAQLPAEGLRRYRILADGGALAILAANQGGRETALATVVERYFMSSHGDEAAYELGLRALDRFDFVSAARLFDKVLTLHPDPTMPKGDLLVRYALAAGRSGDRTSAAAAMKEIASLRRTSSLAVLSAVRDDLSASPGPHAPIDGGQWSTVYGSASRTGVMPSLPSDVLDDPLSVLWGFEFPVDPGSTEKGSVFVGGYGAAKPPLEEQGLLAEDEYFVRVYFGKSGGRAAPADVSAPQLIERWKFRRWRPVNQLLLDDQQVYFKTHNQTISFPTQPTRRTLWRPDWVSVYDGRSAPESLPSSTYGTGFQRPGLPQEVMHFGDQVRACMSLHNGVLYTLEGVEQTGPAENVAKKADFDLSYGLVNPAPLRGRINSLCAIEQKSGNRLWRRMAGNADSGDRRVAFLAAPTPAGRHLLAPVIDEESLWIYALSPTDGKTLWKSYLCEQPPEGSWPWNRVGIAVEGRDAYIAAGMGVVFAIDSQSGAVRMAIRYDRTMRETAEENPRPFVNLKGWDEDTVVPLGRSLLVIASDNDTLFTLDRNTGEQLWAAPRSRGAACDYLIGANPQGVYVAGRRVVKKYHPQNGLLLWERPHADSFGRAALTQNAIYLPLENEIWKLSLETGEPLAKAQVKLPDEEPLGNLFSDGKMLWAVGAHRVYALISQQTRMEMLEKHIAAGDPVAILERAHLLFNSGDMPAAMADLQTALPGLQKLQGDQAAASEVLKLLGEYDLPSNHPLSTLRLLANVEVKVPPTLPLKEQAKLVDLRDDLALAALEAFTAIRAEQIQGAAEPIAGVIPLLYGPEQRHYARRLLLSTVTANDADALRAMAEDSERCVWVLEAYAKAAGESAKPFVLERLSDPDHATQLAAARSLANLGERSSLAKLVELLSSDHPYVQQDAAYALRSLTGQWFHFASSGRTGAKVRAISSWRAWIKEHGDTADLQIPLSAENPTLGRTLVALFNSRRVVEFDRNGKKTWEAEVSHPWACQGLPNGHRLITNHVENRVFEYDHTGEVVWSSKKMPGNTHAVQRLLNGHTVVTCSDANQIVELTPEGDIVKARTIHIVGRPYHAQRLGTGETLVTLSDEGRVVLLDIHGRQRRSVGNFSRPTCAQLLENGRLLVTDMRNNRVVESKWNGEITWTYTAPGYVYSAQQTPQGTILIAHAGGVVEIDQFKDQVLWEEKTRQATSATRY